MATSYYEEIVLDLKKKINLIKHIECSDVLVECEYRMFVGLLKCQKASLEVVLVQEFLGQVTPES